MACSSILARQVRFRNKIPTLGLDARPRLDPAFKKRRGFRSKHPLTVSSRASSTEYFMQSENLPRFQFGSQHVRTLAVSEPVQLLKSRRELLDRLDVRELLDSGKRPLIRGPA